MQEVPRPVLTLTLTLTRFYLLRPSGNSSGIAGLVDRRNDTVALGGEVAAAATGSWCQLRRAVSLLGEDRQHRRHRDDHHQDRQCRQHDRQ